MTKRSKSKTAKIFSVKNKVSIEPVDEIKEIMEEISRNTPTYPKLKIQSVDNIEFDSTDQVSIDQNAIDQILIEHVQLDHVPFEGESVDLDCSEQEKVEQDSEHYVGEKYLTIKQLATILQVELSTIRHWEKEFAEYLGQAVLKNQRKLFTTWQLEVFSKIKDLLKTEQYTIEGAKRRLELDNILTYSLGVEHNFKTTVFIMLSAIMQELQASRQESRELARQVAKLQVEKNQVEEQLQEEQNRGLFDFLKTKLNKRSPVGKEANF